MPTFERKTAAVSRSPCNPTDVIKCPLSISYFLDHYNQTCSWPFTIYLEHGLALLAPPATLPLLSAYRSPVRLQWDCWCEILTLDALGEHLFSRNNKTGTPWKTTLRCVDVYTRINPPWTLTFTETPSRGPKVYHINKI